MLIISCKVCGKKFRPNIWHFQRGWSRCCSKKCRDESLKKGKFVNCDICKKKIWRTPRHFKHSKSGKFFCTKSCQTLWRNKVYSGSNHALWIDGSSRYRKKLIESGKPIACMLCGEKDQRVLQVHHKDGNDRNYEVDNLIWLCLNCHHLVHFHAISLT